MSLKWLANAPRDPNSSTTKAMKVPTEAITQNQFCHRRVGLVPAIRIAVISTIMANPPRNTHRSWVWKLLPHRISVLLLKKMPSVTSVGPRANTGKYRAQNVAPIIAEKAAPKFDTVARGGVRIRLTHT